MDSYFQDIIPTFAWLVFLIIFGAFVAWAFRIRRATLAPSTSQSVFLVELYPYLGSPHPLAIFLNPAPRPRRWSSAEAGSSRHAA